jgi:hypothetical protein
MTDFLEFYDELRRRFPLHLVIYQSRIMDWCIEITKKRTRGRLPDRRPRRKRRAAGPGAA